jgi:hypothetical protein
MPKGKKRRKVEKSQVVSKSADSHSLEEELAYWTPERMRTAIPIPLEHPPEPSTKSKIKKKS